MNEPLLARLVVIVITTVPFVAHASDSSSETRDCSRQIHDAIAIGNSDTIAPSCWHIGPVTLGMSLADVANAMGVSDARTTNRDDSFTAFYVLPRNLPQQLAHHPLPKELFQPESLRITYANERVVAINIGHSGRIDSARCRDNGNRQQAYGVSPSAIPFDFSTVKLGDSLNTVIAKLGFFTSENASNDQIRYWPIPISIEIYDGGNSVSDTPVSEIEIASEMKWVNVSRTPHFLVSLDAETCRVTGYRILGDEK